MITLTQDSSAASPRRGGNGAAVAEQYYALAHWLRPVHDSVAGASVPMEPKSIGITSCLRGAGVSTVASNLAMAVAQTGDQPVLLVDLSGQDTGANQASLAAALAGTVPVKDCVQQTKISNLSFLGGADLAGNSFSSIDGGRVVDLLRELEHHHSFLVIDLPPTDSGLCFATAGTLDGVLLVMDGQRTNSALAMRAKQRLVHANAAVLGVILNHHSHDLPRWLDARL